MSDVVRTYTELMKRGTLLSRFRYLALGGELGAETFGFERPLNQEFYRSSEWKSIRNHVIVRDDGCDMGLAGFPIYDKPFVHHMNPLVPRDLLERDWERLTNPEYLICVSHRTHNAIHFSDERLLPQPVIERRPGDHLAWNGGT